MTRVNKGKKGRPSYVCVKARGRAGCTYKSVRVSDVEEAIVSRLPERLRDAPSGDRNPELDRELANLEAERGILGDKIEALLSAIERGGDAAALVKRLRDLERQFEEASSRVRELERRREAVAGATVHARIGRLLAALEPEEGGPDPATVNLALQTVFRRVVVDYQHGVLVFEWLHGGDVEVPYALPLSSN